MSRCHTAPRARAAASDDVVAAVALVLRAPLLHAHRSLLGRDDLEDAYSQTTLEILLCARRRAITDPDHVANMLRQRLRSRISDRHRAIAGRSQPAAAEHRAVSLTSVETAPAAPDCEEPEQRALVAETLRELIGDWPTLSADQRAVLAYQAGGGERREFLAATGWSPEKTRKVAQRGRARLRARRATR